MVISPDFLSSGRFPVEKQRKGRIRICNLQFWALADSIKLGGRRRYAAIDPQGTPDYQVLIDYINGSLNGVIGREYESAQGRIMVYPISTHEREE